MKFVFSYLDNEDLPPDHNPFTMPADNDIFMLRDKERQRKKAVSFKDILIKFCSPLFGFFSFFLQLNVVSVFEQ